MTLAEFVVTCLKNSDVAMSLRTNSELCGADGSKHRSVTGPKEIVLLTQMRRIWIYCSMQM